MNHFLMQETEGPFPAIPTFDMVMRNQVAVFDEEEMDVDIEEEVSELGPLNDEGEVDEEPTRKSILGKRAAYYKKYISVPRVLKRDIRRQYPKMIVNILNNSDFNLFHSFFRTFSVGIKDIRFRVKDSHGVPFQTTDQFSHLFKRDLPEIFAYQGYAWIFFHWYIMSTLNPDQIVRIEEAKIVTRSDSSKSKVSLDVSVDFHRMYDIHITRFMGSIFGAMINECGKPLSQPTAFLQPATNEVVVEQPLPAELAIETEEPTVGYAMEDLLHPPDPFDYYARKAGKHMPLLPEPQPVVMRMRFTFHLNEQKRIEMLETSHLSVQ